MTEGWGDFLLAVAGAAGALVGLVIVAVSANIREILRHPQLPARAGGTIAALVLVLVAALVSLAPQPTADAGVETAAAGLVAWLIQTGSGRRAWITSRAGARPVGERLQVVLLGQVQTLPILVGGVLLALGAPGAVWVVFAGMVLVFPAAVLDAWVLLVEILR